jgi:hypothetical protein
MNADIYIGAGTEIIKLGSLIRCRRRCRRRPAPHARYGAFSMHVQLQNMFKLLSQIHSASKKHPRPGNARR